MPRYADVNEELQAIELFEDEAAALAAGGVIDDSSVDAIRAHYAARRAEIASAVSDGRRGITRSAAASSTTVPIIAWIGIILVIGAAITIATYVWRDATSWQKVAILLVPAIAAYVISHLLYRQERTQRVGFALLGGANALLVSSLIVAAGEYKWGYDLYNGADVGVGISLFALALAVLWIVRLDSDFYRLVAIIALAVALTAGNSLLWSGPEAEVNAQVNAAWDEINQGAPGVPEKDPNFDYAAHEKRIAEIEQPRVDLWKHKSMSHAGLFAGAGIAIVAFGAWLERRRNADDAKVYHYGGTGLFIIAFMLLNNDIIPSAYDSLIPLILSLVAVWFGLHTERGPFVLAGLTMFLPTLILALTGFGDNLGAIAAILGALGAIAIVIATRAERYRTALLDSISGRN